MAQLKSTKVFGDLNVTGEINASSIVGNITGNADTATKLQTARTINGVPFDGTTDITISGGDDDGGLISTNITVDVGAGGQFTTINQALEYLSKFYPLYRNSGVTATINLKAGFVMAEQVLVRGIDLGWVTIVGEDTETVINHTALTINLAAGDYTYAAFPAFGVSKGGTLPRIGHLFRFNVAGVGGAKHGVTAIGSGSSAEIMKNKGVKDAGHTGIFADEGATINAYLANASGAGHTGVSANRGSIINANSVDASEAGSYGIWADYVSSITADSANASGAGTSGIVARAASTINARSANASGAGYSGVSASMASTINAYGADASGAGEYGIYVSYASTINAYSATGTLSQTANTPTLNGIIYK